MKIGLKLTLMTVALAMMSMTAMASAPTITGVPSTVVIGDQEGRSSTAAVDNDFVYPTTIDLTTSVSDDDMESPFVWSYKSTGTQVYTVNNAPAAATAATPDELIDPATWLYTNSSASNDPADLTTYSYQHTASDNDAKTITFRNATLSPIGGTATDPGAAGTVTGSDAIVALYVSDGTTVSQPKEIDVYTVNNAADGGSTPPVPVMDLNFTAGAQGWQTINSAPVGASIAGTVNAALGLCIDVGTPTTATGDLSWSSGPEAVSFDQGADNDTNWIDLTANSAYRVRTELSTSAIANDTAPTQPMTLIQWTSKQTTWAGANLYFDNEGHANSVITGVGDTTIDTWIVPPGALNTTWQNGFAAGVYSEYPYGLAGGEDTTAYDWTFDLGTYTADLGYVMDFRVFFRVYDRSGDFNSDLRNGSVCMKNILIERYNLDDMTRGDVIYDTNTFTPAGMYDNTGVAADAANAEAWDVYLTASTGGAATTVTWTGGVLTLAPTGTGWTESVTMVARPGTGVLDRYATDPTTFLQTVYSNNAPIPWVADQLLLGSFYMSCGSVNTSISNSVDSILIGFDSAAVETAGVSLISGAATRAMDTSAAAVTWGLGTTAYGPGFPKFTSEPWVILYNTNAVTNAESLTYAAPLSGPIWANAERLRPRFDISVDSTRTTNGSSTSEDPVKVQRVLVEEVSF